MSKMVRRGYVPSDQKEFNEEALSILRSAGEDLAYLMNRGYKIKGASTLVGNRYMLSERQRLALVRALSTKKDVLARKEKECQTIPEVLNIDGFNLMITLEVALSGSLLIKGMDGCIRDLAGLRGNYRIIDKTEIAVKYILESLDELQVKKANIYLDAPVSNSGRLKQLFITQAANYPIKIHAEVTNAVDSLLSGMYGVVSSDAIILNQCMNWVNLSSWIIEHRIPQSWCIDLSN